MLLAVLLNAKYRLIRIETVSIGTLSEALAHPREVFKPAIAHSAHSLVVVHNHPSGDPRPMCGLPGAWPMRQNSFRSRCWITSSSANREMAARATYRSARRG
jgi:hypothetical protein